MASRPLVPSYPVIINGVMTGTITSLVSNIQMLSLMSYSLSWSGASPVGSVSVQVSNDYKQDASGVVVNAGTWNTLPLSSSTAVSGNTGTGFIDITENAGYAMRLVYNFVSGTGTLQAVFNAKVS